MGSLCSCFAQVLLIPYNLLLRSPNIHLSETNRLLIFYRPREGNTRKKKTLAPTTMKQTKSLHLEKTGKFKKCGKMLFCHISVFYYFLYFL